jgi:hypothetical protein
MQWARGVFFFLLFLALCLIYLFFFNFILMYLLGRMGRRGRDRMVVVFTTTCAISAYHH